MSPIESGRLPPLSTELVDWLDKTYPPKCIAEGQTPEAAHRYAGRRELIDELVNRMNAGNEASLLAK